MSGVTIENASLHQQKDSLTAPRVLSSDDSDDGDDSDTEPRHAPETSMAVSILLLLIAFRLGNAFVNRTFFQPDEYFQALEPAWQVAFGQASGAWITWEWREHLRSAFFPYLFSAVYKLTHTLALICQLSDVQHAELLIIAPQVFQAFLAALGDFYTWKLGKLVYGEESTAAWISLVLTIFNPFHFFVITRTLSNCLELTLTVIALFFWFTSSPEDFNASDTLEKDHSKFDQGTKSDFVDSQARSTIGTESRTSTNTELEESATIFKSFIERHVRLYDVNRLRFCLLLAALACVLRITNVFTWLLLASFEYLDFETQRIRLFSIGGAGIYLPLVRPRLKILGNAHWILFCEALVCGSFVLLLTALVDRAYYQTWVFPPIQFLYFNIAEGVSSFYGVHDYSWYFLQGLPLMLGTYVGFVLEQVRRHFMQSPSHSNDISTVIKYEFAIIVVAIPLVFSCVAHKEVRFIYPLLPLFHVLAAEPFSEYFHCVLSSAPFSQTDRRSVFRLGLFVSILLTNVIAAVIATQYHQRGPLSVIDYLRHEYETHYVFQPPAVTGLPDADTTMTVGFLMPCHSTPWRSRLVHSHIKGWALSCEPPIGLSDIQKKEYRDEADQFYDDPEEFLVTKLGTPPEAGSLKSHRGFGLHAESGERLAWDGKSGEKSWPEYLVFFQEKEALLTHALKDTDYVPCWRGWNAWLHDDWRRQGDIVVFCHHRKPPHLL